MISDIDKLLQSDWAFDVIDCKSFPDSKFSQKEAKEMSKVLGQIYSIAHCIHCKSCQTKYLTPSNPK